MRMQRPGQATTVWTTATATLEVVMRFVHTDGRRASPARWGHWDVEYVLRQPAQSRLLALPPIAALLEPSELSAGFIVRS